MWALPVIWLGASVYGVSEMPDQKDMKALEFRMNQLESYLEVQRMEAAARQEAQRQKDLAQAAEVAAAEQQQQAVTAEVDYINNLLDIISRVEDDGSDAPADVLATPTPEVHETVPPVIILMKPDDGFNIDDKDRSAYDDHDDRDDRRDDRDDRHYHDDRHYDDRYDGRRFDDHSRYDDRDDSRYDGARDDSHYDDYYDDGSKLSEPLPMLSSDDPLWYMLDGEYDWFGISLLLAWIAAITFFGSYYLMYW